MTEHPINELMQSTMEKIKQMVDVNTIIGNPIVTQDGTTLIPISKVTFGFGSGGSDFRSKTGGADAPLCFGGGGGAGVTVTPVAFVIVSGGNTRILPVNVPPEGTTDRLVEMIPEVVERISSFFDNRSKKLDEENPLEE